MRIHSIFAAVGMLAVAAAPAFAVESTMRKGETVFMMPDGKMGTVMMKSDKMMSGDAMKMAKPMDTCVIMMMGKDGKMYMMDDMTMADGKTACDSLMSMSKLKK